MQTVFIYIYTIDYFFLTLYKFSIEDYLIQILSRINVPLKRDEVFTWKKIMPKSLELPHLSEIRQSIWRISLE